MKDAQAVAVEAKELCRKSGLGSTWDPETMRASMKTEEVVRLCVGNALKEMFLAATKAGKKFSIEAHRKIRLAFALDGCAVGNDKLTCAGCKAPECVESPNSPFNFYAFFVSNIGDSINDNLEYNMETFKVSLLLFFVAFVLLIRVSHVCSSSQAIDEMKSIDIEWDGEMVTIQLEWIPTGDKCMGNSNLALSTCANDCPCDKCLVKRADLGNFEIPTHVERTHELQDGFSHAVEGAFCAVCNCTVTAEMTDKASKFGKAATDEHRRAHFGTMPGKVSMFRNWGVWVFVMCVLHLQLRSVASLLRATVFPLIDTERLALEVRQLLEQHHVQFLQVSEAAASSDKEAHRNNLFKHTFVGATSAPLSSLFFSLRAHVWRFFYHRSRLRRGLCHHWPDL